MVEYTHHTITNAIFVDFEFISYRLKSTYVSEPIIHRGHAVVAYASVIHIVGVGIFEAMNTQSVI